MNGGYSSGGAGSNGTGGGGSSAGANGGGNGSNKTTNRWTLEELLLAAQGVKKYGKDFQAIADTIGNKTCAQLRQFFTTYRRRYNLDAAYKEYLRTQELISQANNNNGGVTLASATTATIGSTNNSNINNNNNNNNIKNISGEIMEVSEIDGDRDQNQGLLMFENFR